VVAKLRANRASRSPDAPQSPQKRSTLDPSGITGHHNSEHFINSRTVSLEFFSIYHQLAKLPCDFEMKVIPPARHAEITPPALTDVMPSAQPSRPKLTARHRTSSAGDLTSRMRGSTRSSSNGAAIIMGDYAVTSSSIRGIRSRGYGTDMLKQPWSAE
jgi:hypothetical protein